MTRPPRTPDPARPRTRRGLLGLYVAEAVSSTGTRMSLLALPVFVFLTSGSAVQTGVVGFAEMAPYVTAKFLGGPFVDRLGPWRASVLSDATAAVAAGLIPLLYALGALPFPLLLLLVAVLGLLRAPGDAAKGVLLPGVVAAAGVPMERAVGISDGINRLASMLGAPLGGVLIAAVGAPGVVTLDAASFAVGAVVVALFVPRTATNGEASQPEAAAEPSQPAVAAEPSAEGDASAPAKDLRSRLHVYLGELREGLEFARRRPFLRAVASMVSATNLLDAAMSGVLLPVWALTRFGDDHGPAVLGLVSGVFAAGAVAGTAVMAAVGHRVPRRLTYGVCFLLGGAPRIAVLALPVPIPVVVTVLVLCGLMGGAINPLLAAAEYEQVPVAMQARVFGVLGGLAWVGIPFGGLLGGWLVSGIGLPPAVLAVAAAYFVVTLDPFVRRGWRAMERGAAAVEETGTPHPGAPRSQGSLVAATGGDEQ